jgi:adenosylcobinamide-phosphate synthase
MMNHALYLSTPLIALALAIDAAIGDPQWFPHPTRIIGAAISYGDQVLYRGDPTSDLRSGTILTIAVVALSAAVTWAIIAICDEIHPFIGAAAAVLVAWTTLAARELDRAALEVQDALLRHDEDRARRAMPSLVGRDPASLDRMAMIRATVESVAENASDGVIAPLIFLFAAGPVGAIAYKAINTLDSMIGYRNERYAYFGRFAARLDDVANWIPARATALCILAAAELWLRRGREAYAICRRDARRHESPNAGFPEAAMAGGLGVQLGGPAIYDGERVERPVLGDAQCPVTIDDIASARMILKIAIAIAFVAMAIVRTVVA